jgi:hypothetical protein
MTFCTPPDWPLLAISWGLDELRAEAQNSFMTRAMSSLTSAVLAFAVAFGGWTSYFSGSSAPLHSAHHIASAAGSGTNLSHEDLRNPTPVPRVTAGMAITVGPLRVVHPPDTALISTINQILAPTGQLLTRHETGSQHNPPHLHAFSLRI